jgi:hypothetical protein
LPLRFVPARFAFPVLAVAFVIFFLVEFRAGFAGFFLVADRLPPLPPKMLSQLFEYCFVAPTRTMLMTCGAPVVELVFDDVNWGVVGDRPGWRAALTPSAVL